MRFSTTKAVPGTMPMTRAIAPAISGDGGGVTTERKPSILPFRAWLLHLVTFMASAPAAQKPDNAVSVVAAASPGQRPRAIKRDIASATFRAAGTHTVG